MAMRDSQVNAGLVSSNVRGLQLLHQDDDDADEEHKVDLHGKKNKNAGDASSCVIHAQSLTSNQIRDLSFWGINVNAKIIIFSLFIKRHYISFLLWPRS